MSDLPMTREQIQEEILKCFPPCALYGDRTQGDLVLAIEHILRTGTIALREENKRLNAFLAESCQDMRSHGPYDGSGPCPEIMRLVDENKRLRGENAGILGAAKLELDALRSGEFICKKCGLRKGSSFKDRGEF